MATEALSEREQQMLEHLQQAQVLGVSLSEYASAYGVGLKDLYNGKAQLVRKGAWISKPTAEKAGGFIPVEITAPASGGGACRIVHASGWTIECASLPDAAWVTALLRPAPSP